MTRNKDKDYICPTCGHIHSTADESVVSYGPANAAQLRSVLYAEMPNLMQLIKQHLNLETRKPSQIRRIVNRGER